jgi:sucrose-6-phosphate hydrolase SacC (GH32 family)
MPFNQQMTVPVELTLRTTDDGVRLCVLPVKEIESLHGKKHSWKDVTLKPGDNPLAGVKGELFDVRAAFRPAGAERMTFTVRGVPVVYDVKKQEVNCQGKAAPLRPAKDGSVTLQILVDRGSVEVFGNAGRVALSAGVLVLPENRSLALSAQGGAVTVTALAVHELKSAWR